MNNTNSVLLRLEMTLMFIDMKVLLLIYFFFDFYRQTALAADIFVGKKVLYTDAMRWLWSEIGSPYLKWIPIAIIGDFFLKKIVKGLVDD